MQKNSLLEKAKNFLKKLQICTLFLPMPLIVTDVAKRKQILLDVFATSRVVHKMVQFEKADICRIGRGMIPTAISAFVVVAFQNLSTCLFFDVPVVGWGLSIFLQNVNTHC
jgi:hypothetical protein